MFPWGSFFPFNNELQKKAQQMNPNDISKYVEEMIGKMVPSDIQELMNTDGLFNKLTDTPNRSSNQLQTKVFETHEFIFVRFPIKEKDWLQQIRIYHTANQLFIEHIPNREDKHIVVLPCIVKKRGAVAKYKDNTLEIKIEKQPNIHFSEIDVEEL